jgi:large repetitive protein
VDNIAPVIAGCPANITVNANASCQGVATWSDPTFTDNCAGGTMSSTSASGSTFNIGTTLVTYTATDAAGNTATCSFNVNVVDNTNPVIAGCPANISVNANASCQAVVTWQAPTVSDNCGRTTLTTDKPSGSIFPIGTSRVTYTASTVSGESATCFFDVTVVDNLPPVMSLNAVVKAVAGSDCLTRVNWPEPSIEDCNAIQIESTHQPGDEFIFGSTKVAYTLTDALGNTSTYAFEVVVENQSPPVISNCPVDIIMEADEFGSAVVNWVEPTASVACGPLFLTTSHSSEQSFPVGTTMVTYTVSDVLGTKSICTFNVIVTPAKIKVEIAKVVTPDGNGINDFLEIENIEKYKENEIVIVDRWGGKVFQASGYDNDKVSWKGTNATGGLVPTGTYFFNISIRYGEASEQRTGFIELIR